MSWSKRMGTGSLAGNTMRSEMMFLIRSLTTFPTFMSPGPMLITSSLPRENWKLMKGFSMKVSTTAPKQGNCCGINSSVVKKWASAEEAGGGTAVVRSQNKSRIDQNTSSTIMNDIKRNYVL